MRRVTQVDIARATGLSRSTVAKALSLPPERSELSAATRRKVLEAARSLGYREAGGHGVILVGCDDSAWQDPFLPFALPALTGAGLRVAIQPWQGAETPLHAAGANAVVAVAFIPPELPRLAASHGLPCLALNAAGGDGAVGVRPDEAADLTAVVEHLAALGHRRICFAFATGVHPHFSVVERRRAVAAAARRRRVVVEEMVLNHGEEDLPRVMTMRDGPTALILAPVETHPWRMLEARRKRPFALVVVGQDGRNSPVTSVQPDYAGLAARFAACCAGEEAPAADVLLPGRLVVRDTSTPPA